MRNAVGQFVGKHRAEISEGVEQALREFSFNATADRMAREREVDAAVREGIRNYSQGRMGLWPSVIADWIIRNPSAGLSTAAIAYIRAAWRAQHSGFRGVPLRARTVNHGEPCA
jgi:hypothetical protein